MPQTQSIAVVSACMHPDGRPRFALRTVEVTAEEAANGVHYDLVEKLLRRAGYDEPYVHFAPGEAPPFLHSAVKEHLASEGLDCLPPLLVEKQPKCLESSKSS